MPQSYFDSTTFSPPQPVLVTPTCCFLCAPPTGASHNPEIIKPLIALFFTSCSLRALPTDASHNPENIVPITALAPMFDLTAKGIKSVCSGMGAELVPFPDDPTQEAIRCV